MINVLSDLFILKMTVHLHNLFTFQRFTFCDVLIMCAWGGGPCGWTQYSQRPEDKVRFSLGVWARSCPLQEQYLLLTSEPGRQRAMFFLYTSFMFRAYTCAGLVSGGWRTAFRSLCLLQPRESCQGWWRLLLLTVLVFNSWEETPWSKHLLKGKHLIEGLLTVSEI